MARVVAAQAQPPDDRKGQPRTGAPARRPSEATNAASKKKSASGKYLVAPLN